MSPFSFCGVFFLIVAGCCDKNPTRPILQYNSTSDIPNDVLDECSSDLIYLLSSTSEQWALKMLDSFGIPESGILYRNSFWTGNYDECLDVFAPPALNRTGFKGRYCMLSWPTIKMLKSPPITSGVCIPNSCHDTDILKHQDLIFSLLEMVNFPVEFNETLPLLKVTCLPIPMENNTPAIIFAIFLALLVSLVLLASAYELYLQYYKTHSISYEELIVCKDLSKEKAAYGTVEENSNFSGRPKSTKLQSLLLCFSAIKNGSSIIDLSPKKGQLDCLNGIRVLSMAWVVLCHTHHIGYVVMSNQQSYIMARLSSFALLPINEGSFSVDSFFLLSGFLLAYSFMKNGIKQMGAKEWAFFYLNRYLRLTPAFALILGVYATCPLYLGSGPFLDINLAKIYEDCQENWWSDLLYINNFRGNSCMKLSWYLACDMELFVISPIFLVILQRRPKVGVAVIIGTMLASWILSSVLSSQMDWSYLEYVNPTTELDRAGNPTYFMPYYRIGPYLVGMLVAIAYLKFISMDQPMKKWVVMVGWTVSTILGIITFCGPYYTNPGASVFDFYLAISASSFAMSIGWVIFACITGNGGPVNWILSWKIWIPLSRVNYCAYLIHFQVIMAYFIGLKDDFHYSQDTWILMFLGFLMEVYALAFVSALITELPFAAMQKLLIK